MNETFVVPLNI